MTSQINYSAINSTYPVASQDNNTQGFRDNFAATKTTLQYANSEITDLQINSAVLNSSNNFGGNQIYNAEFKYNSQTVFPHGSINGNVILNWQNGQVQEVISPTDNTTAFRNAFLVASAAGLNWYCTSGNYVITGSVFNVN